MAKQTIYTLRISGKRDKLVEGTLEYLIDYYSYTLLIGHSWNPKINQKPTTIKSLVTNLQKSFEEQEAACYNRTYVEYVGSKKIEVEPKKEDNK